MKFKNKGRKIYKTKEKNYYGKSPVGKAFSVGLTVLLIGGIGFIGYSLAEPLINYSKKKGDNTESSVVEAATEQLTDENGEPLTENTDPAVPLPLSAEKYRAYALSTNDLIGTDTLKDALKRVPAGENIEFVEVPLKVGGAASSGSGVDPVSSFPTHDGAADGCFDIKKLPNKPIRQLRC